MRHATFCILIILNTGACKDYCSELCHRDPNCNKGKGSYCKSNMRNPMCFAYYFTSPEKDHIYYHSLGDTRRHDLPVRCTDAEQILTKAPREPDRDYCWTLCKLDKECLNGPKGSHVKKARKGRDGKCFGYSLESPNSNTFTYSNRWKYPMYHKDARRIAEAIIKQRN